MSADVNDLIAELKELLPQMQELIQSNNSFYRYILPAIIAGVISAAGILINNFMSVYVFKKKRSLEYGRFYLPYLSYLKDIDFEVDLLASQLQKDVFFCVICSATSSTENCNIHLRKISESLILINNLFEKNTYYIINRKINTDVLKVQTLIMFLEKCKERRMTPDELQSIEDKVMNLNLDIKGHIKEIEKNS